MNFRLLKFLCLSNLLTAYKLIKFMQVKETEEKVKNVIHNIYLYHCKVKIKMLNKLDLTRITKTETW